MLQRKKGSRSWTLEGKRAVFYDIWEALSTCRQVALLDPHSQFSSWWYFSFSWKLDLVTFSLKIGSQLSFSLEVRALSLYIQTLFSAGFRFSQTITFLLQSSKSCWFLCSCGDMSITSTVRSRKRSVWLVFILNETFYFYVGIHLTFVVIFFGLNEAYLSFLSRFSRKQYFHGKYEVVIHVLFPQHSQL